MAIRRWVRWGTTAALGVLALTGCGGDDDSAGAPAAMATYAADSDATAAAADGSNGADGADGGQGEAPADAAGGAADVDVRASVYEGRDVIYTAELTVRTPAVAESAREAAEIVEALGGVVAGRTVTSDTDGGAHALLVVKVPPARYETALERLSALGEPVLLEQTSEDVTDQVVDLDSRVANARASVARIRELMDRASSISDITRLEAELSRRESDLESTLARLQALRDEAALGTITLDLVEPPKEDAAVQTEDDERPGGFVAGLRSGWDAFVTATAVVLTVLGAVLPFAVPLLLAAGVWRAWRRRRPAIAQPAAGSPS